MQAHGPADAEEAWEVHQEILKLEGQLQELGVSGSSSAIPGVPVSRPREGKEPVKPKAGPPASRKPVDKGPCDVARTQAEALLERLEKVRSETNQAVADIAEAAATSDELEISLKGRTQEARDLRSDASRRGLYDPRIPGSPINSVARLAHARWAQPIVTRSAAVEAEIRSLLDDLDSVLAFGAISGDCEALSQAMNKAAGKAAHLRIAAELLQNYAANEIMAQASLDVFGPVGQYKRHGDAYYEELTKSAHRLAVQLDIVMHPGFTAKMDGADWVNGYRQLTHADRPVQGAIDWADTVRRTVTAHLTDLNERIAAAFSILSHAAAVLPMGLSSIALRGLKVARGTNPPPLKMVRGSSRYGKLKISLPPNSPPVPPRPPEQVARINRYLSRSGGRLGGGPTRLQNHDIASGYEARGYTVKGDGRSPEEYIPALDGGKHGSTYVDLTATRRLPNGKVETIRIQTIDTLADGMTPTPTEAAAAARIRAAHPNDTLVLIPKNR